MQTTSLKLLLTRTYHAPLFTSGILTAGPYEFTTIERPWMGENTLLECIPPGRYRAVLDQDTTINGTWILCDVPKRSYITLVCRDRKTPIIGEIILHTCNKQPQSVTDNPEIVTKTDIFAHLTRNMTSFILEIAYRDPYGAYNATHKYHSYLNEELNND